MFRLKWNNEQYIQISMFIGKQLWWRPFKYNCRYEGLQLYKKVTPSLGDCFWFLPTFWTFVCFISNKSTNCLGFSETAAHKWLTVFSLKIFEDNQIITNVKSNILLIIYTQQRKRIVFTRSNHHPNVFHKKVFCNIRETHRKTSLPESFLKQLF